MPCTFYPKVRGPPLTCVFAPPSAIWYAFTYGEKGVQGRDCGSCWNRFSHATPHKCHTAVLPMQVIGGKGKAPKLNADVTDMRILLP
eukprot:1158360-Pelagomonas_calceolata.AAC.2